MGRIICAGLGPGDPELISVKSDRLIRAARHVAFFRKKGRPGQARRIVEGMLATDVVEHAMEYPVTTELAFDSPAYIDALAGFYDDWAARLESLAASEDVVVLCEGDPFFYGSFMHLYIRLKDRVQVDVIPGITGMSGCWTMTGQPVTWGDDVLSVVLGTMKEADLVRHIAAADAVAIMKIGGNLEKVRRALAQAGKLERAWLVERGTMSDQRVARLADVEQVVAPYFAIVIVHGEGRRPLKGAQ